jgi:hypothetical protein
MLPENEAAWQRLGRLLADRRIEVGARYRNKNLFAEEREINRRMVWSVETGARDTYGKDTIRAIESAYALVPGSVERTVAGGPLEPLPVPGAARAAARAPRVPAAWDEGDPRDDDAARLFRGDTRHDRLIRNIWRLGEAYETPEPQRIDMIEVVDPELAAALRRVGGQSEAGLQWALQSHVQLHVLCNESVTSGLSGYHRTVPVRDD